MRLLIAMYPGQNKARITATAMNANGMPVKPVTAYAVGIPGAHRHRGDGRQHECQHGRDAEPVASQRPGYSARSGDRSGSRHW